MTALEKDPNGLSMNEAGAKADDGKKLPFLVLSEFANALEGVVTVGTYGANKYTPRGWISVQNAETRYKEAAFRHMLSYMQGHTNDTGLNGSGLPHLDHIIWNLLAVRELQIRAENYHLQQAIDHNNMKDIYL